MPMNGMMALATNPQSEGPTGATTMEQSQEQSPGQSRNFISQDGLADEREQAYESAFRDQAYSVFSAKFADLIPSVVTFKVIKSSIDEGDAIGAFILSFQGETVYVPVVMTENRLKPMEIIYSKRMDKFLPLNKDWLQIILGSNQQPMGEGAKTPDLMSADVDITTMIRPPIDGRNVYAMDLSDINHLDMIKSASDQSKAQYRDMLKGDKVLLKFAAENFDLDEIKLALVPAGVEKIAVETVKLETLDLTDPTAKIKKVFGNQSKMAVKDMAKNGFAVKDERIDLNHAMAVENKLVLEEPSTSGVYTIYMSDGTYKPAIVLVEPDNLEAPGMYGSVMAVGRHDVEHTKPRNFLVILEDGDFFKTCHLIASPGPNDAFKGAIADQVFGRKKAGSVTKSNICFIKCEANIITGTEPRYVDATQSVENGGKKYVKYNPYAKEHNKYIYQTKSKENDPELEIIHIKTHTGRMIKPKNSHTVVIPDTYHVVKLGDSISDRHHLTTPQQVLQFVQQRLVEQGAETVKVASLGAGEYAINGRPAGDLREASTKLAEDYHISMKTSMEAFSNLKLARDYTKILVYPNEKRASVFAGTSNGSQMPPEMVQQMAQQDAAAKSGGQGGQPPGQPGQQPGQQPGAQPGQPPGDPSMMQAGVKTGDPDLYSLGVLNTLSQNPDIKELLAVHSPTLEKAMDSSGRMLLTFWIRGTKSKKSLGEESYFSTEEALRTVFKGIGSLLIKINRQTAAMPDMAGQ